MILVHTQTRNLGLGELGLQGSYYCQPQAFGPMSKGLGKSKRSEDQLPNSNEYTLHPNNDSLLSLLKQINDKWHFATNCFTIYHTTGTQNKNKGGKTIMPLFL